MQIQALYNDTYRQGRRVLKTLWKAGIMFTEKSGTTLASSSTFYILTAVVPTLLLIIRGIGLLLGNVNRVEKYIFHFAKDFFPSLAPELVIMLKNFITGPLFAGRELTIINFVFLTFSGVSFLNSIYNGLYIISEDKSYRSLWKYLRGMAVIGISLAGLIVMFYVPRLMYFGIKFVQTNFIMEFFYQNFEMLKAPIKMIKGIRVKESVIFTINFINFFGMLIYFSWLYRWFFNMKITWKQGFIASLCFTGALYIGKSLFWIYFVFVRDGLKQNYGDLYTSIIGVMWVFFLMCFFYYGACICNVFIVHKNKQLAREHL